MLHGAFALLGRSLRIDARSWSTHLTRLGLVAAIYMALCFTLAMEHLFGAPGLRFFGGIAYLDIVFMTLLGLGYFSTPITEEKEEDTLGLMLMAGISPLGILAGKSGGRLWQALLLVAVQYPLMMLSVTMGGITGGQIMAVTVALLAYMVFLNGFGLLCSTLASNSRQAGGWVIAGLMVYFIVPNIAITIIYYHNRWIAAGGKEISFPKWFWDCLEGIGGLCVLWRLSDVLSTGFGHSPWSLQVFSNIAAGVLCAGLSWLLFSYATRSSATEATTRGLVARQRSFFRFPAGRPGMNPFIWKDFHFIAGGFGMILVRVAYYGVMAVAVWSFDFVRGSPPQNEYVTMCLLWMSISIAVEAGIILAGSMHDEVRGQTLASLMMIPRSSTGIIYSKFAGAMLGWLPGPIIVLVFTFSTRAGKDSFWSLFWNNHEQAGFLIFLLFALIPHFATVVSLYIRWGSVPIAIGMTIGVYFLIVAMAMLFAPNGPANGVLLIFDFVLTVLCVACHLAVLLRVQALAAR